METFHHRRGMDQAGSDGQVNRAEGASRAGIRWGREGDGSGNAYAVSSAEARSREIAADLNLHHRGVDPHSVPPSARSTPDERRQRRVLPLAIASQPDFGRPLQAEPPASPATRELQIGKENPWRGERS